MILMHFRTPSLCTLTWFSDRPPPMAMQPFHPAQQWVKRLAYTPANEFTGTDTFTYQATDGASSSAVHNATISVFDAFHDQAQQIGADIDGAGPDDQSGDSVALSSDGRTRAVGAPYQYADVDGVHVKAAMSGAGLEGSWLQVGGVIEGRSGRRTIWQFGLSL